MKNQAKKQLMFVLYDGVGNSVFQSQVLKPLANRLNQNPRLQVTLVSFERREVGYEEQADIYHEHDRLSLVITSRPPFIGRPSLLLGAKKLSRLLRYSHYDEIIARGPLAGFVCMRALQKIKNKSIPLTVQARGLCAEEYRYAHGSSKKNILTFLWYLYIKNALHSIEKNIYSNKKINIESVSPALKDYLISTFGSDENGITIASKDIPKKIDLKLRGAWRIDTRKELRIRKDAQVFCYSGSYKPWQCADETIEQFLCEYKKNKKAFLLIITIDKEQFLSALERQSVPKESYRVISVHSYDLLHYLAAADVGFMLRKKDIVNWVSRPTKMLEYQAVGLKVVHNNTVGWLVNENRGCNV